MKSKFQNVRGMQDFFNKDVDKYDYVINTARRNLEEYNFHEIVTPIIEYSELFERNLGDTTDVISKEVYKFEDKGGNMLSLRPEFTAGVIRSFLNNGELNQDLPQKLFSIGPVFRYDRPQKGRYRQFNQVNCEYIGNYEYLADVEMIILAHNILKDLGLENITLEINSLGSTECKNKYQGSLRNYLEHFENKLSEDSKIRLKKNPLRILDSKDPGDKEIIANAPKIIDFCSKEDKEFYNNILKTLNKMEIKYTSNPLLVRGLDYYTSTVFEFTTTDLGAQATVLAGGRYNDLIEQMGGSTVSAIGFGAGVERLMELINKDITNKKNIVAIIPVSENENIFCLNLANKLRKRGQIIEFIYCGKFKKRMEKMNKCGARFAVVIGENEIKSGKIKIKNLENGTEEELGCE